MSPRSSILLSLAALTLLGGCTAEAESEPLSPADVAAPPQAPEVRVETARLQGSQALLDIAVPGEIRGSRDALLASPTGGFVEKVYVDEGDEVRAGQPIAAIDRRSATARKDQAQAQLDQARAELARIEKLGDLATAQQLDGAKTQVRLAEAQAELADVAWQRALVTAPFSGVVGQIGVEVGEVAGPGSPIARLVQLDPVEVTLSVADRDVVGLKAGMPVAVQTDANAGIFTGTLQAISPAADLSTRSFVVKASVENPDRALLPGMIARVALAEVLAKDAIVLPQEWLVTRIDGVGVYVVEEGVARWRPVTPGKIVHDQVVIESGLAPGETIVINGHRTLADGDPLLVAREGTCCEDGRAVF
ncbi:MAG: efflux RND transporter periplasmic adaptor subunit [Alphaproteobacteria bacterium]|nr:efflux RND transporter periplasmic adaptor subunit [Alphaproteobacteria bacterium]